MDIKSEQVQNLLDYVYSEEDYDENLSMNEYKKLKRIMSVMVQFYERGRDAKLSQKQRAETELNKIEEVEKLVRVRQEILEQFPSFHPKRQSYGDDLDYDLTQLLMHKKKFEDQHANFAQLYEWGVGIAEAMNWLEANLQDYGFDVLGIQELKRDDIKITSEQYLKFKRGLEEVTYNLQESQDFFDASLDGRLQKYHQIEKCMIEAQIQALESFSDSNPRKNGDLDELKKDLDFVIETMTITPAVQKRRERMRDMHKDFFAVLKWQREKMIKMLEEGGDKIIGDIQVLKEDLKVVIEQLNQLREQSKNKKVDAIHMMNGGDKCPVDTDKIHKIYEDN